MKRSKEMAEISRLPIPVMEEWEWQYKGACRDLDPEMFFHPEFMHNDWRAPLDEIVDNSI